MGWREGTPLGVDRHTPVKTVPFPILRMRPVKTTVCIDDIDLCFTKTRLKLDLSLKVSN